jgi:hypothetical protein
MDHSYNRDALGVRFMYLTRREILEQLERLGIRTLRELKRACREFESYWYSRQHRTWG